MGQRYTFTAKKMWLNKCTGQLYDKKPSKQLMNNCIKFDSKAEYQAYLEIKDSLPNDAVILTQQPLWFGKNRWLVDFKITLDNSLSIEGLTTVWEKFNLSCDYRDIITDGVFYLEFKGVKNKSFQQNQERLIAYPDRDKRLMLITPNGDAYYNDNEDYVKLMPSIRKFTKELQQCLKH